MKLRKRLIQIAPIILVVLFLFACVKTHAEEATVQDIANDHSGVAVNLNSQIKENGSIKKQGIKNVRSWCNININRNTYKFYYTSDTKN